MRSRGTDLQIPTNEIPALDAVIDELNLRGKSRPEVLGSLRDFFSTKFTYRMWQDADNEEDSTNSPLGRFLLKTRAGHCEYFATATFFRAGVGAGTTSIELVSAEDRPV